MKYKTTIILILLLAIIFLFALTNKAYAKYPQDVIDVINAVKDDNTKTEFFKDWAIVGCDIGASAGVLAADKLPQKPRTIVMISPVAKAKGLYIPVSLAQLDSTDFLVIVGNGDTNSQTSAEYLKKFAQSIFSVVYSESKTSGNLMFKNDPKVVILIREWLEMYFPKG